MPFFFNRFYFQSQTLENVSQNKCQIAGVCDTRFLLLWSDLYKIFLKFCLQNVYQFAVQNKTNACYMYHFFRIKS